MLLVCCVQFTCGTVGAKVGARVGVEVGGVVGSSFVGVAVGAIVGACVGSAPFEDVYMYPPSTPAASFCMRMIGWVRRVSAASMVLHALAIVPTTGVADRQTTALSVRGQRGVAHTRPS